MYPGVYRPMTPPPCSYCVRGKRLTPLTGREVDCNECNGTGIAGNTRALFLIATISVLVVYGAIVLWIIYGR